MPAIREASFNDYQDIKVLQNRYGLPTKGCQEWEHLWRDNPATADIKKPWPMGWVLENDDKQIVGYLGNIPATYEFKEKRLITAVTTSFVVDVNYRNYSVLLTKKFLAQKDADLFLNTTANYEAGKICSAFKIRKVPVDSYDIFLFWIINYRRFISSALIKKGLPSGYIIEYPLSLAMRGADKLLKRNRYLKQFGGEIRFHTAFDERFDIFWENLKKRYHNRLLRVRDRRHLDWHFKYAIARKKIWICAFETKSRITGYAIFLRADNPEIGLKRIRLIDLQSIDDDPHILMEMVSAGIKRCQKEDIHILEIIGFNAQKRDIMERYSPYKRKFPHWPFFYKAKDELLAKELEDPKVWDPTLFDGDGSL